MKIPVFCILQAVYCVYGIQRLIDSTIKLTIFMIFYKFRLLKGSQFYIIIVPNIVI